MSIYSTAPWALRRVACRGVLAIACLVLAAALVAGGEAPQTATIVGKALAGTGTPVAGVKLTFSEWAVGGKKPQSWTATTSADGTCRLTVPASRNLYLTVEGPPGGKLAPCSVTPARSLRLQAGQVVEVAVLLAPATARLSGKVTDPEGRPLPGATVELQMGAWSKQTATADPKGRYSFPALAPGGYVIKAVGPPPNTPYIRLYSWRPGGVRSASLSDGQSRTEDFQLPRGTRLVGRVLDANGKPLAGVAVSCRLDVATEVGKRSVYQTPGQWYRGEDTTDAKGRYSLGGLTRETYVVEVKPPEGSDLAPAALHDVNALEGGGVVKLQDIRLYKGGVLLGTVVGADGKPVEGATASLRVGMGRHGTVLNPTTDARGRFELRGLPTGGYDITVRPPAGSASCEKVFERVAVVGGLSVARRFELPEGARVSGRVTAPDGRPVAGATVMARYGYHSRGRTVTDEQGRYTLLGISPPRRPGPRRRGGPQNQVFASPPDAWPTLVSSGAPLPDVAPGRPATVNVTMKHGVAIQGTVTGPDGKPLAGCQVSGSERRRSSLRGYGGATTDADGRYLLAHLPAGNLFVSVAPPGGTKLLRGETTQRRFEAGKTATVDVALRRGATVVGEAVSSKGKPVVGAQVLLQQKGARYPRFNGTATSGVGGAFRIEPVPPGTFELRCTPSNRTLRSKATAVTVAGTAEHKVRVVVFRTGTVSGVVRDAKGEALTHGTLWLTVHAGDGKGGQRMGTSHPSKEGQWRVGGLPPGHYTVVVTIGRRGQQKGLAAPAPISFDIEEGEEKKLDVKVPSKASKRPAEF